MSLEVRRMRFLCADGGQLDDGMRVGTSFCASRQHASTTRSTNPDSAAVLGEHLLW